VAVLHNGHRFACSPDTAARCGRERVKSVWLQGLCVDSLEWSAAGEKLDRSIPVAIEDWKANMIRLPVKDHFWFGRGPWQNAKEGGVKYRKVVDAVVEAAATRGAYVAVDLHGFGAPTEEHVEFWKDVATRYKNHPAVFFELFNEPHGITWKTWRDGGNLTASASARKDKNPAENVAELTGEVSPGMQRLLDAVRATGARNLVIAGGLDWGYDLSGVAAGYALEERRGGNGIMYSSHVYPWKSDWQHKTLDAAARYPVFIGEVGCPASYDDFKFIPPAGRQPLEGWAVDVLGLIQKHRLHWTGFSFHPKCGPNAISDWSYTPTPYWGVYVKDALSGKQLELKKMR
jgi:endoglucanase